MKNLLRVFVIMILIKASISQSFSQNSDSLSNYRILPDSTIANIKAKMVTMIKPYSFKDLFDLSVNAGKGAIKGKNDINNITDRQTIVCFYGNEEKVEVVSSKKATLPIDSMFDGVMVLFGEQYKSKYDPKRLITFYKPSIKEPSGIYFEKFIIWDSPKVSYIFYNDKWYFLPEK